MPNMYAVQFGDSRRGVLIACRRPETAESGLVLRPRGITADAAYEVENAETGEKFDCAGTDLQQLSVKLPRPRTALILFYREKK